MTYPENEDLSKAIDYTEKAIHYLNQEIKHQDDQKRCYELTLAKNNLEMSLRIMLFGL